MKKFTQHADQSSTLPSALAVRRAWRSWAVRIAVIGLVSSCLCGLANATRIIYVNVDAQGQQTGADWVNAYVSPHQAFATAQPGDEVWVAAGVYHPAPPGDVNTSFAISNGVRVYGGFDGTENRRGERNWKQNLTILSGDLADDDVFGNPWWNGWNTNSPNSKHVVTITGCSIGTLIDGVVVSNGNAIQTGGGGIYAWDSDFEIRNCTFTRNSGYQGSGSCVFVWNGSLQAIGCNFEENWGRFVTGVGIFASGTAGATIDRCRFYDNHAESDASLGEGAGIALLGSSPSTVKRCVFLSNVCVPFYSTYPNYGGAVYNAGGALLIDRCIFRGNKAIMGGGVYSARTVTISNSLFDHNEAYAGPTGGGNGGAISTYFFGNYTLKVTGCTVVNNRAHETAGVWFSGSSSYTTDISNSIFWGNSDVNGIVSQSSVKQASYSCVQNLWITIPGEDPIDPEKFPNCFDSDPKFVNGSANFRLQLVSPCIDAADKTKFQIEMQFDLDSLWRFIDIPAKQDTGNGAAPLPDMGCFEAAGGRHIGIGDWWMQAFGGF